MTCKRRTKPCENTKCDKQCIERLKESEPKWKDRKFCSIACMSKSKVLNKKVCTDKNCAKKGQPQILRNFAKNSQSPDGYKNQCKICWKKNYDLKRTEGELDGVPKFIYVMQFWATRLRDKNKRAADATERRAELRVV